MKKVLILGDKGMLGNAVFLYLKSKNKFEIFTTEKRWGDENFKLYILNNKFDYIINCIGSIPQKNKQNLENEFENTNVNLPLFLESVGSKIIHPSTDCEFSGKIVKNNFYSKLDKKDAEDDYGKSKAKIVEILENKSKNTKIIRTSIIGFELNKKVSLLEWFLNNKEEKIFGYINHFWNGITTLEWAKQSERLIDSWENYPILTQISSKECISKYDLLKIFQKVFNKYIIIEPMETEKQINKCLISDFELNSIEEQIHEMKDFYEKKP